MCAELEKWGLEERTEGRKEGRIEGRIEGRKEGRKEGESRLTTLLKRLKADGRLQDWDLAIDNETVREKLYQEYHIE